MRLRILLVTVRPLIITVLLGFALYEYMQMKRLATTCPDGYVHAPVPPEQETLVHMALSAGM